MKINIIISILLSNCFVGQLLSSQSAAQTAAVKTKSSQSKTADKKSRATSAPKTHSSSSSKRTKKKSSSGNVSVSPKIQVLSDTEKALFHTLLLNMLQSLNAPDQNGAINVVEFQNLLINAIKLYQKIGNKMQLLAAPPILLPSEAAFKQTCLEDNIVYLEKFLKYAANALFTQLKKVQKQIKSMTFDQFVHSLFITESEGQSLAQIPETDSKEKQAPETNSTINTKEQLIALQKKKAIELEKLQREKEALEAKLKEEVLEKERQKTIVLEKQAEEKRLADAQLLAQKDLEKSQKLEAKRKRREQRRQEEAQEKKRAEENAKQVQLEKEQLKAAAAQKDKQDNEKADLFAKKQLGNKAFKRIKAVVIQSKELKSKAARFSHQSILKRVLNKFKENALDNKKLKQEAQARIEKQEHDLKILNQRPIVNADQSASENAAVLSNNSQEVISSAQISAGDQFLIDAHAYLDTFIKADWNAGMRGDLIHIASQIQSQIHETNIKQKMRAFKKIVNRLMIKCVRRTLVRLCTSYMKVNRLPNEAMRNILDRTLSHYDDAQKIFNEQIKPNLDEYLALSGKHSYQQKTYFRSCSFALKKLAEEESQAHATAAAPQKGLAKPAINSNANLVATHKSFAKAKPVPDADVRSDQETMNNSALSQNLMCQRRLDLKHSAEAVAAQSTGMGGQLDLMSQAGVAATIAEKTLNLKEQFKEEIQNIVLEQYKRLLHPHGMRIKMSTLLVNYGRLHITQESYNFYLQQFKTITFALFNAEVEKEVPLAKLSFVDDLLRKEKYPIKKEAHTQIRKLSKDLTFDEFKKEVQSILNQITDLYFERKFFIEDLLHTEPDFIKFEVLEELNELPLSVPFNEYKEKAENLLKQITEELRKLPRGTSVEFPVLRSDRRKKSNVDASLNHQVQHYVFTSVEQMQMVKDLMLKNAKLHIQNTINHSLPLFKKMAAGANQRLKAKSMCHLLAYDKAQEKELLEDLETDLISTAKKDLEAAYAELAASIHNYGPTEVAWRHFGAQIAKKMQLYQIGGILRLEKQQYEPYVDKPYPQKIGNLVRLFDRQKMKCAASIIIRRYYKPHLNVGNNRSESSTIVFDSSAAIPQGMPWADVDEL